MEVRPPRRAQITGIQAGGTQAPLCLALGLSRPLRLRVSCLCCPAAAQGTLNTPDTFQLADLSCSLTHENPSSSRSSAVDGEVKVTMGMVRGGSQLGGWGLSPPCPWGLFALCSSPPGPPSPQPCLWSLTFRDTCLVSALGPQTPVWWQGCGPSQGDVPKETGHDSLSPAHGSGDRSWLWSNCWVLGTVLEPSVERSVEMPSSPWASVPISALQRERTKTLVCRLRLPHPGSWGLLQAGRSGGSRGRGLQQGSFSSRRPPPLLLRP